MSEKLVCKQFMLEFPDRSLLTLDFFETEQCFYVSLASNPGVYTFLYRTIFLVVIRIVYPFASVQLALEQLLFTFMTLCSIGKLYNLYRRLGRPCYGRCADVDTDIAFAKDMDKAAIRLAPFCGLLSLEDNLQVVFLLSSHELSHDATVSDGACKRFHFVGIVFIDKDGYLQP